MLQKIFLLDRWIRQGLNIKNMMFKFRLSDIFRHFQNVALEQQRALRVVKVRSDEFAFFSFFCTNKCFLCSIHNHKLDITSCCLTHLFSTKRKKNSCGILQKMSSMSHFRHNLVLKIDLYSLQWLFSLACVVHWCVPAH